MEETERQPRRGTDVDVYCIPVCRVNVRRELKLLLRIKDDFGGCRPCKEVAESGVQMSFRGLDVSATRDIKKPHVMSLRSITITSVLPLILGTDETLFASLESFLSQ